jgi:predicted MPP superfamily phosphohydrolase
MKLVWVTDIHLNFLEKESRMNFYQKIVATEGDGVLITGDIGEARSTSFILKEMASVIQKPIYFVLGNHDYYHSNVNDVRKEMTALIDNNPLLFWLPASGPQKVKDGLVIVGNDCFADGRHGDYANSPVVLNDSRMIGDLFQSSLLGKYQLLEAMQRLADQDASDLENSIKKAIDTYHPKKMIVLVHVPPFIEACMHEGEITDDDHLPFFASKATGDRLLKVAEDYKDVEFFVLCGHTHSKGFFQSHPNLIVKVGAADYGKPEIQEIITL